MTKRIVQLHHRLFVHKFSKFIISAHPLLHCIIYVWRQHPSAIKKPIVDLTGKSIVWGRPSHLPSICLAVVIFTWLHFVIRHTIVRENWTVPNVRVSTSGLGLGCIQNKNSRLFCKECKIYGMSVLIWKVALSIEMCRRGSWLVFFFFFLREKLLIYSTNIMEVQRTRKVKKIIHARRPPSDNYKHWSDPKTHCRHPPSLPRTGVGQTLL